MTAIIFDTETTGIDNPDVIELATMGPLEAPTHWSAAIAVRFKPTKPIMLGAMATHHIIEDDLIGCEPWQGWSAPAGVEYLVGHNIDFDWRAIGEPNIKRIDTLAFARSAWPTLDSHSLSACMYHIFSPSLAREMLKSAHSAAADVEMCHKLLFRLLGDLHLDGATWEEVWSASEIARIPTVMAFGKHKGMPIKQIPGDYKRWLLNQSDVDPYLAKALRS